MSYTPTEWKAGDTVTSAKLNKMEQGIAACSEDFIIHANESNIEGNITFTLDKTFEEILNAGQEEKHIRLIINKEGTLLYYYQFSALVLSGNMYMIMFSLGTQELVFQSSSLNDYPIATKQMV